MQRTEEQKAKQSQTMKDLWAIKKAAQNNEQNNAGEPDYKTLYVKTAAELKTAQAKLQEFESICKSYANSAQKAKSDLQRATLEYNARVKYMLDCVKHAHISMQFAVAAVEENKGGNND